MRSAQFLLMVVLVLPGLGCGPERLPEPEVLGEIDDLEAESLAESLRVATQACDMVALRRLFDIDAVLRRGLRATSLSGQSQRWLFDNTLDRLTMIRRALCGFKNANLSLLSIRRFPGRQQRSATFLAEFQETDSFDYIEFLLGKDEGGELVADDLYYYSGGWFLSEKIQEYSEASANDYFNIKRFDEVQQLLLDNPLAGMQAVHSLSAGYRDSKSLWLLRIQASAAISSESNIEVIRSYSEMFPGDASLKFHTLGELIGQKRYDEVLSNIDQIDRAVGGDSSLDDYRLDVLLEAKEFSEAKALAAKRIAADPSDKDWHLSTLDIDLRAKDYAAALVKMKRFEQSLDTIWTDELVAEDLYPEFGQSQEWKQYKEWLLENDYVDSDEAASKPLIIDEEPSNPAQATGIAE